MNVTFTDHFIHIKDADPREEHMLQHYHNAVFSKKTGWRLPKNIWCMRELLKSFPKLGNDATFVTVGKDLKRDIDHLLSCRVPEQGFLKDFAPKLRPYQKADVVYLRQLSSAGIFNQPRTGKTPTTITLLKELGKKRNLIVAPASLIWNWEAEVRAWWPEVKVYVVDDTKRKREGMWEQDDINFMQRVVIVSKDTLKSDIDIVSKMKFHTMVVDEAQFLRNYKTAQSKAVFSVKAERRYALSGTPTVKGADDIFGILHFLFPERFPSYWQFVERYFEIGTNRFSGGKEVLGPKPNREKELQELVGLVSVARKRKEVMEWLPDKQRVTHLVEMTPKQKKLYNDMKKYFLAADGDVEVDTQNVITQLMRLRQICLDPRLLGFEERGAKTDALLEYLENTPGPVVIMSWFTSFLKLIKPEIEKLGLKVGMIHGEQSGNEKAESAAAFQAARTDVLLCNIVSGGTGFTLDRAEEIIFLDKMFNPSDNEQAEDRITPTTEAKNHKHTILSFVCKGSADERINHILEQKKSLTDFINEGGREAIKKLLEG